MLILIRHAEKAYPNGKGSENDKKHDPPLTKEGMESCLIKSKQLIESFGAPDMIICSPYQRCRQTANFLNLNNLGIKVESGVAEYLGNHKESKLDITEETSLHPINHPETWRQFQTRIINYSKVIRKLDPNKIIWVITHGVVIQTLCKLMKSEYKKRNYEYLDFEIMKPFN